MYDFVISSRKRRMDIYYIYILEYISTSWYESGKVINRVFDRQIDSYSVLKEIYILFYWKITDERRIKTFVPKSRMSKETRCGSNQNDDISRYHRDDSVRTTRTTFMLDMHGSIWIEWSSFMVVIGRMRSRIPSCMYQNMAAASWMLSVLSGLYTSRR